MVFTNDWVESTVQFTITAEGRERTATHKFRSRVSERFIDEVEKGIDHGIKVLDEKKPGWIDQIDLEQFDLGDASYCVCGQLFADEAYELGDENTPDGYEYALRFVMEDWFHTAFPENGEDIAGRQASRLGFNLPVGSNIDDPEWEHEWQLQRYDEVWMTVRDYDEWALSFIKAISPPRPYLWDAMTQMWKDRIVARQKVTVG